MSYEEIGIRVRADGVVETSNGFTLTGRAADDLGKQLDAAAGKSQRFDQAAQQTASVNRMAAREAAHLAQAYRQLPMQITDIVTSLASGMPIWMVAIQQGGQLKDSFGGISPAIQAMLSLLTPARLAVGGVGLAATAVALAYAQAEQEASAFTRAIATSGNAAGVTRNTMADLARSVGAVVGTQGAAAEMVAKLVSTAQVGRAGLQQFTEVGVRMQRELGVSADDVAQKFAELGREPVKASIKLNEQHNYLTLAVYQQIKALQEQGRWTEAAALAQQTYADAMNPRLKTLEGNLGTLEKAWRGVKDAAAGAWDAILNVGRESTKQQEIDRLQKQIESYEEEIAGAYGRGDSARAEVLEKELAKRRELQAVLQSDLRLAQRAADMQAAQAAAVREGIKADHEKDKKRGGGGAKADPYERLNDQIAKRLALAQAELDSGDKLSAADVFRLELLREIDKVEKDIGATKAGQLRQRVDTAAATMRQVDEQRAAAQAQAEIDKAFEADRQAATRAAEQQTEALEKSRAALVDEGAALTLSKNALFERAQVQLDAQIADKQARIERIAGLPGYEAEATELQRQVDLLREIKGLKSDNHQRVQKAEEDAEYKRRTDSLAQSIEDGFVNGFREGRSLADIFFNELKAQAARTLLRMPIQAMAQTGTNWIDTIVQGISMFAGSGMTVDSTGYGIGSTRTDGVVGLPTRGGAATGSNYIERDMLTILHEGEAVIPKAYNPAAGGAGGAAGATTIHFSPQIHIDSRTDKAEVMNLVGHAMRQSQAQLLEMMQRRQA